MDFEFTDDQLALRDAAPAVLAGACPPSVPRAILDGGDAADAADADEAAGVRGRLWSTLRDLDWPAVGIAEAAGGVGLGAVEVAVLAEELARAAAPTPLLATATQYVPIVRLAGAHDRLRPVAAGEVTGTLALAEGGRWDLDHCRDRPSRRRRLGDLGLEGRGLRRCDGGSPRRRGPRRGGAGGVRRGAWGRPRHGDQHDRSDAAARGPSNFARCGSAWRQCSSHPARATPRP